MVKPWITISRYYSKVKENFKIPVLAYQVSGEYSLIKNGIRNKLIDENALLKVLCVLRELEPQ